MHSFVLRGGLVAAAATVLAFGYGLAPEVKAQQVAATEAADAKVVAAKGAWVATKAYVLDDLVTSRGSTWRAKRANTNKIPGQTLPTSTAPDWEVFAAGFNPLGAWSGVKTYQPNDLVNSLGSTWRAKRTSTNVTPVAGADWQQLAAKGAAGATGATGATGPAGPSSIGTGTASAPSFAFTGDSNTGIFSPSAGKIAMVEDGALFLHNIGTAVTGIGLSALGSNSGGSFNTAVGNSALAGNTTGDVNTAVGASALAANTTGSNNIAVGKSALINNTSSHFNIAIGNSALQNNTSSSSNVAIGHSALLSNTNGVGNVAVGNFTLVANTAGVSNVAVGDSALSANTTASDNVAIGRFALKDTTGGDNNIAIGASAGLEATSSHDSIFIGNIGGGGDANLIRIGTKNTQTSTFIAGIYGASPAGLNATAVVIDEDGQLGALAPSSRRFKNDIQPMGDVGAMLQKLRPVTFRYNQAQKDGSHPIQYGLIAEEVAEVFPDLALFGRDGQTDGVKYQLLPNFLLAGYQSQQKVIDAQAGTINAQAAKIEELQQTQAAQEQRLRSIEAMLPKMTTTAVVR
jgi:hypothetical protein